MFPIPDQSPVATADRASAAILPRYEDVAQDGRMLIAALPPLLGNIIWRDLLGKHPMRKVFVSEGVVPILTRVIASVTDSRIAVHNELLATGSFAFARQPATASSPARLLLNMWVTADGVSDRTYGLPPADKGARLPMGTMFAEHVFTRLFAPPDQRRVTSLEIDGQPFIPDWEFAAAPLERALEIPKGATVLDEDWVVDPAPFAFGLSHTDSNQHVNSMVYPRLFEEAALRRFAALGHKTVLLARDLEVGYRKPMFAGESAQITLRAFSIDGHLGAVGYFSLCDGPTGAKPHCYVRMVFR